jgi:(aminoalkyl)phosphonate N-acetyltransferase
MVPADAAAAAALTTELGYPVDSSTMQARIERISAMADHGLFVACRVDRVVGWIHVLTAHHLQSEARAEIGGLVVTADARSGGIGAMLVARAEQWARDSGLDGIVVRSQIMREAAHRFYLREGYKRTKTSAVFAKDLGQT